MKRDARTLERALKVGEDEAIAKARSRLVTRLDGVADELRRGSSGPLAAIAPMSEVGLEPDESRIVRRIFLDEALEHLEGITTRLAAFEAGPLDAATLGAILRATHTLKGAAATVGLRDAGDAAHRLEGAFAALQAGRIGPTPRVLEKLGSAIDALRTVIEAGVELRRPRGRRVPQRHHVTAGLLHEDLGELGVDAHVADPELICRRAASYRSRGSSDGTIAPRASRSSWPASSRASSVVTSSIRSTAIAIR